MKLNKLFVLALVLCCGCAMPATIVKTVDTRPSILVAGAPDKSLLFIDGNNMGNAAQYAGNPSVLIVEAGTHKLVIVLDSKVIFSQTVFVESEMKRITVK